MFFILSSYENSMSLMRRGKPVDFIAARQIRIIPILLTAIVANLWILSLAPMRENVSTAHFLAKMTLMPQVCNDEYLDPVMWTPQIEMTFCAKLVGLFQLSELKRYFLGRGSLLAICLCICQTLNAMQSTHDEAA